MATLAYVTGNVSTHRSDGAFVDTKAITPYFSSFFPGTLKANVLLQFPTPQEIFNHDVIKIKQNPTYDTPEYWSDQSKFVSLKTDTGISISVTNLRATLPEGNYIIRYQIGTIEPLEIAQRSSAYRYILDYTFSTLTNRLPLAPYTITDCITRCLELAEPLQKGDIPRFRFEGVTYDASTGERNSTYTAGSQAERYDKVLAPPFTMTQCTLREQLKIIGGFIHAEPRLTDGVITFEPFCGNELAEVTLTDGTKIPLNQYPYAIRKKSQNINEYCTSVDTRAENLVNSIDKRKGSIIDPDGENYRSIRSETINIRISDTNGEVQTAYPIYEIEKVMCGIAKRNPQNASDYWQLSPVDITDYIVEETAYRANLSSYSGAYPYSKAYAIYYSQGSPNIKGLFFKAEDFMNNAFDNYAIVNILAQAAGKQVKDITDIKESYPLYSFQVTYKPIYNARFVHSKPYVDPDESERTLFYNQSENLIETSYYGENVKGAVARLGNAEQSLTYYFKDIDNIPKAGQLFDDDNYISAVMVQVMPSYLKCTVTLSKDFNRLSEYIGVKSLKYLYEVNERAAYDRTILLKEYIVVGAEPIILRQEERIQEIRVTKGKTTTYRSMACYTVTQAFDFDTGAIALVTPLFNDPNYKDQQGAFFVVGGHISRYQYTITVYYPVSAFPTDEEYVEVRASVVVNYLSYVDTDSVIGEKFIDNLLQSFINAEEFTKPITGVLAQAKTKNDNVVGKQIALPVIASAFGNVMTFSWTYKDNYSAGEQSAYVSSSGIKGYWAQDVPYKDYFGRFDYYDFSLTPGVEYETGENYQPALDFPEVKGKTKAVYVLGTNANGYNLQYLVRADSRETLNFNLQIEFRTNRQDLIIGSALASFNPLVTGAYSDLYPLKWYFFTERLNKFVSHAESQAGIDLATATSVGIQIYMNSVRPVSIPTPPSGKKWASWAIVTNQTQQSMTVEDSDGNIKTIYKTVGGDIMLASNVVADNATPESIAVYFAGKHKLK